MSRFGPDMNEGLAIPGAAFILTVPLLTGRLDQRIEATVGVFPGAHGFGALVKVIEAVVSFRAKLQALVKRFFA